MANVSNLPTEHLVADCPKAIGKEKGALEVKLEALKQKKKGKELIGAWDQDISESEGDEKENMCFMAKENEVQSSPSNSFSLIDDNYDVDPSSMLIEMYDNCKKASKRNKDLRKKTQFLLDENSKLICENKSILQSLEVLKKEKERSNNDFQKLAIGNKNLCEKKKVNDLTLCIERFTQGKENFEELLGSQRSPYDKSGIGYNHYNASPKTKIFC
ncbi:hypothetical protein M9H77_02940 [Catharanthus roseus]|uniref:Uncharacterized protein n=1 Tax=Catharanthus roseus TaxID=4058 RepID=A0ACC0C9T4_CATRO|nr:hypothetical protein M9H77_02940 [Catharanthus roseus]